MALINYKIPEKNFELILKRIGYILTVELENQAANYYVTEAENVGVYVERFVPIDKTETSMINVSMATGDYGGLRAAGYTTGDYKYYVDIYTNSKTKSTGSGDSLSAFTCERLTGICQAILEDAQYKTLGFTPGLIGNVRVARFNLGDLKKSDVDALNTKVCRLEVDVKAGEVTQLITAPELMISISQLILANTPYGYKYEYNVTMINIPDYISYNFPDQFEGDTFNGFRFQLVNKQGEGVNLAGASMKCQFRKNSITGEIVKTIDTLYGITVTDEANGNAEFDAFYIDPEIFTPTTYFFDLQVTIGETITTVMGGTWTIKQSATEP